MKFVACFIISKGKILTLMRSSNEIEGGKYGLVGGAIEDEELAIDSIIREIYEETKLTVTKNELEDLGRFQLPFNDKEVEFNCYKLYLDEIFIPELDPNEAGSYEWVTVDQLFSKNNLVSGLKELIEELGSDKL